MNTWESSNSHTWSKSIQTMKGIYNSHTRLGQIHFPCLRKSSAYTWLSRLSEIRPVCAVYSSSRPLLFYLAVAWQLSPVTPPHPTSPPPNSLSGSYTAADMLLHESSMHGGLVLAMLLHDSMAHHGLQSFLTGTLAPGPCWAELSIFPRV